MKKLILLLLFTLSFSLLAQEKGEFNYKLSGFVKTDVIFDSRQSVTAREGHFMLYPAAENLDVNGDDINATPGFNMLSIQSRVKLGLSAPDFLGAKTSGVIEGAFFGQTNGDVNGFRLRHAFVKLSWKNTSLLIGQYWNPFFVTDVFPGTISFNTGVPFKPFARNPQIRFGIHGKTLHLYLIANSERDFTSTGPNGGSSTYLRNSAVPVLSAMVQAKSKNFFAGAGARIKMLNPRLSTGANVAADETVTSMAFSFNAKYTKDHYALKFETVYGEDLFDLLMLGGYAVSEVKVNDEWEYTNYSVLSSWIDVSFGKKLKGGFFAGYTQNLGTEDNIAGNIYARGSNIEKVFRVSPRVTYQVGKVRFGCEIEYTSASYGTIDLSDKGKINDVKDVGNLRVLFASYLFF